MLRIDRKSLQAPARVLDLELAPVNQVDEDTLKVENYDSLWCLSRLDGIPQEISFWDIAEDISVSVQDLRHRLGTERIARNCRSMSPPPSTTASLDATVVICTRDRPTGLRATLASLECQTDSNFQVLVVDNSSSRSASATVVEGLSLPRCEGHS